MAFDNTNYTEVEYLEADASTSVAGRGPYINLGLSGGHYRTVISGCFTKLSQFVQRIYGFTASYANENFGQSANANASNVRADVRGANTTFSNVAINTDHIFELRGFVNDSSFTIDGITNTLNVTSEFNVGERYLFAGNANGSLSGCCSFKMYYCRIYDSNDDLVMNLVPCQNKNTLKYGMYDTVGETFYGTVSSYDFTGGSPVASGPKTYVKINGVWTEASKVYIKVNGAWIEGAMNVKAGGSWKDS